MNNDSSDPTPESTDHADFDPELARRLRRLAEAPTPDIWRQVATESPTEVTPPTTDDPTPTDDPATTIDPMNPTVDRGNWRRTLLVAATIAALVAAGVALIPREGQRVETPAGVDESDDNAVGDDDKDAGTTTMPPTSDPDPTFPADVDIGPDRTPMSSIPIGSFAVTYDAGIVIVNPDGEVLGHHPTTEPGFPVNSGPSDLEEGYLPAGCQPDRFHGREDAAWILCRNETGPTVEVLGDANQRHVIASFPEPPDSMPSEAAVVGHFVGAYPSPAPRRGGPMLIQMSAECESPIAMMVDSAVWTENLPNGGTVRHLDGTSYWDDSWPAGESVALGWSDDGSEAYVWRFNGVCSDPLDQPGVYAYELDGSSRLLFSTNDQVHQVVLITEKLFPLTNNDGLAAMERSEDWKAWAGPLTYESVHSEDFNNDPTYWTDLELMASFVSEELGITDGNYALSATDPGGWIVTDRDISIRLGPSTWFGPEEPSPEDIEQWYVERADTFWPNGDDFLSVDVNDRAGAWIATVVAPTHGATVSADYTLGDRQVQATFTDNDDGTVEIKIALEGEPTEPAMLTIRWHDGDRLIGFQRNVIPPGEFAAG